MARPPPRGAPPRAPPDRDAADDGGIRSDRGGTLYSSRQHLPVRFGLESAILIRGTREAIVGEHDAMPDEDLVIDDDAFADESV